MTKPQQNPEAGWFGNRKVDEKEKTRLVEDVFSSVATRYDLMNDLMSGGLHRLWKRKFLQLVHPRPDHALLDLAGGTGDIAIRYLEKTGRRASVTVCDLSKDMLEEGRARAIDRGILSEIEWVEGNAEKLPFKKDSFDSCTIAFGLRNVARIDTALKQIHRVLKPGGRFYCLEFSRVVVPVLDKLYEKYSDHVIPRLGEWVAKDAESYRYLVESIRKFPDQENLKSRIAAAGFAHARFRNMSGGIVAIHSGIKPAAPAAKESKT
ncbi:MAG: bifunctional demethylmenaquinone methyltransferase/2-methoxy-6-polyprenyl-1,4-benzoquinol methylase UbiE [Micavibrio sp.]|nr:MAG: bifunctional demethylmenaquinone methyltransferase/2-methoxy-6-polyprenyl-1,4-benzoquinol methylase UbiE [Micavibrio sp.]